MILSADAAGSYCRVHCNPGTLEIAAENASVSLDSGRAVPLEELIRVADEYLAGVGAEANNLGRSNTEHRTPSTEYRLPQRERVSIGRMQALIEETIRLVGCVVLRALSLGRYRGGKESDRLAEGGLGLATLAVATYMALTFR